MISVWLWIMKISRQKLSFSAGQYFEVKIEHIEMTQRNLQRRWQILRQNLKKCLKKDINWKLK